MSEDENPPPPPRRTTLTNLQEAGVRLVIIAVTLYLALHLALGL